MGSTRTRRAAAALLVATVAFLPFLRGFLAGGVLYFRDLSRHFFPLRHYVLDGLRAGELRYWNPLNHEGIPMPFAPLGYPLEALQLLWPSDRGLSMLLALHVSVAAVAFLALARSFGLGWAGACLGALSYALGGFALSTVNLYVYVETLAWAPVVVLTLRRAHEGRRPLAWAALAIGMMLSTAGIEIALQALLLGVLLAHWERPAETARSLGTAFLLGGALAAPVLLPMQALTAGTDRGLGFSAEVVLNQSVHPFTFLQVVVGNLYGDLGDVANRWWGVNFFPNGFPYILSLYLGAALVVLAAFGLAQRPLGRRLGVALMLAVVICLGRFFVLGPLVEALPPTWRLFRFPTKAFFTVHFAVALLAALGLDRLRQGAPVAWKRAAFAWMAPAVVLIAAPLLPRLLPGGTAWFLERFFPPGIPMPQRPPLLYTMTTDAAVGGLLCAACALVAAGVAGRRLPAPRAAALIVALVAGDLLRTGGGLNPMAGPAVLRVSPEVLELVSRLPGRQRVYTCDPVGSGAYWRGRAARRHDHELFTFATWMDSLSPNYNMRPGIATAFSEDLTSLVPRRATPRPGQGCAALDGLVPSLRRTAVSHVLSLDPLAHSDLQPAATLALRRVAPLVLHVYALREPSPMAEVAGDGGRIVSLDLRASDAIVVETLAEAPATLYVRSGFARGWRASVAGREAPLAERDGHLGVVVPAGPARVELRYSPPGLHGGLALFAVALGVVGWLVRASPKADARVPPDS
jgi:hypothetical protein